MEDLDVKPKQYQWRPATISKVAEIIARDLEECDELRRETYRRYAIPPYLAVIDRHGKQEQVVVVARKGSEVMYWEDVDEGFNTSEIAPDGSIANHYCNQDPLSIALTHWLQEQES